MTERSENLKTVPQLMTYIVGHYSNNIAIAAEDGNKLTYSELAQAVEIATRAFIASGIKPGDRIAVWAPNCAEWIIATLGLQTAGAVLVPLSTRLKGREAGYILRKSSARMLIAVSSFLDIDYPALIKGESIPHLEKIILFGEPDRKDFQDWSSFLVSGESVTRERLEQRHAQISADSLADIMFTSGTTGNPKGVMTTHDQNITSFDTYSGILGLKEGDRYLIINPFFHTFGYKAGWLSAMLKGATIYPQAVFDAHNVLELISRDRITILPGPPILYQTLLSQPDFSDYDLSSLRLAITGSAHVPVELIRRMNEELGFDIVLTAYGLTETCGLVSMCSPDDDLETIANTAGRAIPGTEIRIVDDNLNDVPTGCPGEVLVRSYNVMKGYFEDLEQTEKTMAPDGWLRTGDEGVMNERGYLSITGRKNEMFIVGGFNCYPAEIENILLEHPAILQTAVIGIKDERLGEVAKAFIVLRPNSTVTPQEIIDWSRQMMANYKVPRQIEIRTDLPMTASGKIQKFILH